MRKICFILSAILVLSSTAYAIEVREASWGFDGKAVPGRMNILSVLVDNPTDKPFEGVLKLRKSTGIGLRAGAVLEQPCFVSPFSSRWVQFYPYVQEEQEKWVLSADRGVTGKMDIPVPKLGSPARVYLVEPGNPFGRVTGIRAFQENLFPPSVSATDGLHSVVMDHAPGWQKARSQAFMDWVRRGGTVHVLHADDGEYPVYPSAMSALNAPLDEFRVGAGLVVRHPVPRSQISDMELDKNGFSVPKLQSGEYYGMDSMEGMFFNRLGGMTRPEHKWSMIYFLALVYLAVVGPGNYFFGRKRRKYWITLIFFGVSIFCFGYIFSYVGQRGYGETALVHTLSYARALDDDDFDVAQWTSTFVTSGYFYEVSHDCPHSLYSTCQSYESVNGIIRNGKDGKFIVDMPLYSSRAFHHRARMQGHTVKLEVVAWQGEDELEELQLSAAPGFPEGVRAIWVLYRDNFYQMRVEDSTLKIDWRMRATSTSDFLSSDEWSEFYYWDDYYGRVRDKEREFAKMMRGLIARAVDTTEVLTRYVEKEERPDDSVDVFIFASGPEEFKLKKTGFGEEISYVLYHVTLFRPE
jgi:hypothetical protein